MIKLSILLFLLGIFHNHFYICVAYGRFARTTSNLCRHDIYMTHVYCAFNVYVGGEEQVRYYVIRASQTSYGYPTGPLSKTQLQRTLFDLQKILG